MCLALGRPWYLHLSREFYIPLIPLLSILCIFFIRYSTTCTFAYYVFASTAAFNRFLLQVIPQWERFCDSWHKLFIAAILVARVRTTLHRPFRNLASESRRCYVAFWLPEQVHEWRRFYQRLFVFSLSTGYFHRLARLVLSSAMHSVLPHVDSTFPLLV